MVKKTLIKILFFFRIILALFVVLQIAGLSFLIYKAKPLYLKLKDDHITIKKKINLNIDTIMPITSSINTKIDIPIKKWVSLNMPIQGNIEVSIDEPFNIPVTSPIHVSLDHLFPIKKDIHVNTRFEIDQNVKTKFLGFDRELPIKGEFPINLTIPLDEDIRIKDQFSLVTTAPLTCQIKHDLSIPINLSAKTQFMIDQKIPVPVNAEISTNIRLTGDLPCFFYLDIYYDKKLKQLKFDHSIQVE